MADATTSTNVAMSVAASALRAQQSRMRVIAENIANADSVGSTPGATPYQRQTPVFEPHKTGGGLGVAMTGTVPDQSPYKREYHPGAPSADPQGYVLTPNVDPLVEALDMRQAQRAYEANLNVIETARSMQSRTLDLLKK